MYLGSIVIDDPGIYYEEGDEIVIEPSHGSSKLNLEYRRWGLLGLSKLPNQEKDSKRY